MPGKKRDLPLTNKTDDLEMDLKAVLKKNQAKLKKPLPARKLADIADQDRPYFDRGPAEQKQHDGNVLDKREHSVSKPLAIREHIVSDALAVREHNVSKALDKRESSVSVSVSNALAENRIKNNHALAKREHSVSNHSVDEYVNKLAGKEKILVMFIFKHCQSIGSLESQRITTETLKNSLNVKDAHLRNLIFRVSEKGVFNVSEVKQGRFGWRRFAIPQQVYDKLHLEDSVSNALATSVSNALAYPLADDSRRRRDINIKESTATVLPDDWKNIDVDPLRSINFGMAELLNIFKECPETITAQIVQDSINQFAWGLERNPIRYEKLHSPAGVLVKHLQQGTPWAEATYVSPEDKSRRIYLEQVNTRKEEEKKLDEALRSEHFNIWEPSLTEEERNNILPEDAKRHGIKAHIRSCLVSHHKEHVWQEKRKEFYEERNLPMSEYVAE